jgi:MYXO-CTERM domain-containing protein
MYREGVCNTAPPGRTCNLSLAIGDGHGTIASAQGFALLFALMLGAAMRRRRRPVVSSGAGAGGAGRTASKAHR